MAYFSGKQYNKCFYATVTILFSDTSNVYLTNSWAPLCSTSRLMFSCLFKFNYQVSASLIGSDSVKTAILIVCFIAFYHFTISTGGGICNIDSVFKDWQSVALI